jgi:hypothetical protein
MLLRREPAKGDDRVSDATDVRWLGDSRVEVDGVAFEILSGHGPAVEGQETALHLRKTRDLIESVIAIVDEVEPRRIFELGICHGGSVALLELLARPQRHVAVELASGAPMLDAWLQEQGLTEKVRTYYGTDQADAKVLHEIVARDFGGEPLDLVIDDASHLFEQTRASFNVLFPYVRPGGLYVIEDWSWVHMMEATILAIVERDAVDRQTLSPSSTPPTPPADAAAPSPARLLVELLLGCADPRGAVAELRVGRDLAIVRRGPAPLDPATFDVASLYGPAGASLSGPPQTV